MRELNMVFILTSAYKMKSSHKYLEHDGLWNPRGLMTDLSAATP